MTILRPVLSLIAAVWFLQLAGGILGVLTPLGLSSLGVSANWIGFIGALHAAGFMIGAYFAPRIIGQLGNIRCFASAAALCAIGALLQGLFLNDWVWGLIRVIQGLGFALMFASAEAWLGVAAPAAHRGSVLGLYNVFAKAALLLGPLIVVGATALAPENYLWAGLFLAAALVPVCITRQVEPQRVSGGRLDVVAMVRVSPSALTGVFVAGIVNSGIFALLPIYAARLELAEGAVGSAALAFAIVNAGGLISQWPAGKLSDRFERRNIIALLSVISAIAALGLVVFDASAPRPVILLLLFIWGAGSLSFYGICVAHGVDRIDEDQVTALMSALLLIWALGSVIGPLLAGGLMRTSFGPPGLFLLAVIGLGFLAIAMLIRRIGRSPVADSEQIDWQPVMPAGLPGSILDPRSSMEPVRTESFDNPSD